MSGENATRVRHGGTVEGGGFVFGGAHREYMRRAFRCTVNVAEGAVRAGKTIDNVFVFASLLEKSQDKFHLASGSTLGNAKLNIGDCNGLGLERIFEGRCAWTKYRGNDALRVHTKAGERIVIFSGGKNSDSFKRIRGNSYGMWIATEINLHSDSFIKEAFNRQLAAKDRRVFWDLNPSTPNHFIYREYLDKFAGLAGENYYNYSHFTIRDNPVISEERLREIVSQYDTSSVWYRRDILGERCAAEGLIYRQFADNPLKFTVADVPKESIEFITVGVDFGGNRSRTTFVATAILRGERGYGGVAIIEEHAVSGGKGEIDGERINGEFLRFLKRITSRWKATYVKYVFADCEAQYLISGLRRSLAHHAEFCSISVLDSAKRPISDRIAFVVSLMSSGKFFIHEDCVLLRDGLSAAVWDEKSEGDKRLDNFSTDIDILDAMEYSIERYMGKFN